MPVLDKIIGLLGPNLLEAIGSVIDKFVTTDKEREQAKKELTEILLQAQQQSENDLTDRQKIDMNSDSWLAKNIRPLSLIFVMLLFTLISLLDGNVGNFKITEAYRTMTGEFLTLMISFYFGSRGVEKIVETMGRYGMKTKKDKS